MWTLLALAGYGWRQVCNLALNLMPRYKQESCGRGMFNTQASWVVMCGLNVSVLEKVNSEWEDENGRGMFSGRTEMKKIGKLCNVILN